MFASRTNTWYAQLVLVEGGLWPMGVGKFWIKINSSCEKFRWGKKVYMKIKF